MRQQLTSILRTTGLMPLVNRVSNWRYALLKRWYRVLGKDAFEAIYSPTYFDVETELTAPTASDVVEILLEEFQPTEVLDVGCGTAVYLAEFQRRGVRVEGLEGSRSAIDRAQIDPALIRQVNLCEPFQPARRHPFVICFEVAEHLPENAAATFAATLSRCSEILVFSAAQPGQGGVDHINEQPSSYWIAQFERESMLYDDACTQRLRRAFVERSTVWWLQRNVLVFRASKERSAVAQSAGSATDSR